MSDLTWDSVFLAGSLIDLDVGIWSGLTRLKPEDLGIAETPEVKAALQLGHERLIPKEALEEIFRIVWRARTNVELVSLRFTAVQGARFVPVQKREQLEQDLLGFQADFNEAVQNFLSEYEKHKAEMRPLIETALRQAAKSPQDAEIGIARILNSYPSIEALQNKFKFCWRAFGISVPKDGAKGGIIAETEDAREVVLNMVRQLREEATEKLTSVLQLLIRGGKFTSKTVNSVSEVCKRLKSLNFFQDEQLEAALNQAMSILSGEPGQSMITGLAQVGQSLKQESDENFKKIEESLIGLGKRKITF
jgi:hypothetical protein